MKNQKKKPPKRKNVSQNVRNGTLVITNDKYVFGTDGRSDKTRMSIAIDSNRKNQLAIVKLTTSTKHGRQFKNDQKFDRHGDMIYTKDNIGNPIIIEGKKFIKGSDRRSITQAQANEIKRRNVKESKYRKE